MQVNKYCFKLCSLLGRPILLHISFFYLKCCLIIFDERPHHFGKYTKIFGNAFKVDLVLGKVFISFWHSLHVFGQIFIAVNCQISKTQSGCYYFNLVLLFGSLYLNSNVKENKLKKRSGWAHIQQWII